MLTSFAYMFHFLCKLLFNFKISMTFISIVTYAHFIKKVTTKLKILTYVECLSSACPYMTFSKLESIYAAYPKP